ncbi:universal stress protein family, putative [Synechococcus sp. PCC 7335]|uniref:universal stress protein n=1 Tax=Synechococcus sp. (strain ATCC 29403 / PCC 7335) TaxID=91464 RepID=UPI00017ECB65|nr:universal stress protein [Synechococcus sp. PCC 7335]EDX83315.1 universal stress protein family, putative [Synechococcus sp. PCC 7335]
MYHKILVAIDNSPMAQPVFERALSLAKENSATLLLLHVLSSDEQSSPLMLPTDDDELDWIIGSDIGLKKWREQWQKYESECLGKLQALAAEARSAEVNVEFRQITGGPGRTISQLAKTWGADLIVIGNRGHSGLSELLLGSVSNYVLHHSPCSVLTVKAKLA